MRQVLALLVLAALVGFAGGLAGCGFLGPAQVPFDTLGRGDAYTLDLEQPAVVVARTPAQRARLAAMADDAATAARIRSADLESAWVLAVFSGMQGSSGYGVTVREIRAAKDRVRVTVELTRPAPGQMVNDVITYPYHVVAVPTGRLPAAPDAQWAVYTADGTLLARATGP